MKLYDHVFKIIDGYHPSYTDEVGEENMKDFSNLMINKVLSMDYNLIDIAQACNKYLGVLSEDAYVKMISSAIPRRRYNLKYKKGSSKTKVDSKVIDLIMKAYRVPYRDAEDYYYQLNQDQINEIQKLFGI